MILNLLDHRLFLKSEWRLLYDQMLDIAYFINFLKQPSFESRDSSKKGKLKTVVILLLLEIPIMLLILLVASHLEHNGLLPIPDNSLPDFIDSIGLATILVAGVIVLPLFEELIVRSYLTFPRFYFSNYWLKKFGYILYGSAFIFAIAHLFNFSTFDKHIYFLPIAIAPQFILGIFTGYIRIIFGLSWSYLFHSMHNLVFLSLYLISGE